MGAPDPARYAPNTPFPPYRHAPGRTPHPRKHPDGHSYNTEEYAGPPLTMENWRENQAYLYGVDLFNYGYWWEAHEAWEGLWGQEDKRSLCRGDLQGLIQMAAALVKWREGNRRGVEKLGGQARIKLERVDGENPVYMGLRIAAFIREVESALAVAEQVDPPLLRLS